jgi:predicted aspartyl protease
MLLRRCLTWILPVLFVAGVASAAEPGAVDAGRELGKYLAQHGYGVMRVDNGGENNQIVEPYLDGKRVEMIVDTGCATTCITHSCARDLGLDVHASKAQESGIGGKVSGTGGVAVVKSFTLTKYEINRTNIIHVLSGEANLPAEGLFGYDFMHLNAVLLPVGARFFLFKPGAGAIPPIDSFMTGMGYKSIPLTYGKGGLRIEGNLNGHALTAVVDCGCAYTLFDSDFVTKTAGTHLYGQGFVTRGVDGRSIMAYLFAPRSLGFGNLTLEPTEMTASTGNVLPQLKAQALLGYDLLAMHRAIIDLGHNVLWMK